MRTLLLGTMLATTGTALADCSTYVGAIIGSNHLKGRWTSDEGLDQKKTAITKQNSLAVGGLFGVMKAHGNFVYGAELDIGTGTSEKNVEVQNNGSNRRIFKTTMSFLSHARLILGRKIGKFTPFVGVGLSGARFNHDLSEPDDGTPDTEELTNKNSFNVGANISAGVIYDVDEKWSVRLEGGQDMIGSMCVPGFGDNYEMTPTVNFFRLGVTIKL